VKYSDKLPRVTLRNKHRCQCLTDEGKRCRKMAYYEVYLWDDPEWHSRWLCVYVCQDHAEDDERQKALHNALNRHDRKEKGK
jgi:DNA-binding transcriptional regulator PaaX